MRKSPQSVDLASLEQSDLKELHRIWREQFGSPPPAGRAIDLVRLEVAWRLQARSLGGLDTSTKRALRAINGGKAAAANGANLPVLAPGSTLIREWRGKTHVVKVTASDYVYDGRVYTSLSAIARVITGARWSGPRFFGPVAP